MIAVLVAAALSAGAASPPTDAERQLVEARHLYSQSCEVRAYAAFDDLCDKLKQQMRVAERANRDAQRNARRANAAAPRPAQSEANAARD